MRKTVADSTTYHTGSQNRSVSFSEVFTPDEYDNVIIVKKLGQGKFPFSWLSYLLKNNILG